MEHLLGSRSNDSDRSEFLGEREGAEDIVEYSRILVSKPSHVDEHSHRAL